MIEVREAEIDALVADLLKPEMRDDVGAVATANHGFVDVTLSPR